MFAVDNEINASHQLHICFRPGLVSDALWTLPLILPTLQGEENEMQVIAGIQYQVQMR
jgi:hypothetical protein